MNKTEHLLICLSEECSEVQKSIAKSLRFGLDNGYPNSNITNRDEIITELIDLKAIVELLINENILCFDGMSTNSKKIKLEKYMELSRKIGLLK